MKNNITPESYSFVEKPTSSMYSIKILEGIYSGIIITYGRVSIKEAPDKSHAKLSFQYTVNESVEPYNQDELENSDEFRNYLGDILTHIITSAFDSGKFKIGNGNKPSVNDTTETDQ